MSLFETVCCVVSQGLDGRKLISLRRAVEGRHDNVSVCVLHCQAFIASFNWQQAKSKFHYMYLVRGLP